MIDAAVAAADFFVASFPFVLVTSTDAAEAVADVFVALFLVIVRVDVDFVLVLLDDDGRFEMNCVFANLLK